MNGKLRVRIRIVIAYLTGAYFIWMAYMLLTPRPSVPKIGWGIDLRHIIAFGALGAGVGMARRGWTARRWFVLLLLWATGSEVLQELGGRYLQTGRCFEWVDIFRKALGASTTDEGESRENAESAEKDAAKKGRGGAVAIVPRPPFSTKRGEPFDFSRVEFLVVRRSATVAAPGALCFPGGGIEPGEEPRDAVVREFLEEVGLEVEVGRFLGEGQTPTGAPLFWFAADARSADPNVELTPQPEEVAAVEWRTLPSLLEDADFLANNCEIVQKIVDGSVLLREERGGAF